MRASRKRIHGCVSGTHHAGVALGFASRELFSNFFGGLVLFFTQPFVVGNAIKVRKWAAEDWATNSWDCIEGSVCKEHELV